MEGSSEREAHERQDWDFKTRVLSFMHLRRETEEMRRSTLRVILVMATGARIHFFESVSSTYIHICINMYIIYVCTHMYM